MNRANYRIILSFRRKLDDFERLQYQLWSRFVGVGEWIESADLGHACPDP